MFEEERDLEKLEMLKIIKNSDSHLLSLVNNILDFFKINAGKMEIEKCSFSIHKGKGGVLRIEGNDGDDSPKIF